jgi:hypothetical protein
MKGYKIGRPAPFVHINASGNPKIYRTIATAKKDLEKLKKKYPKDFANAAIYDTTPKYDTNDELVTY